jgi:hypothetical protein
MGTTYFAGEIIGELEDVHYSQAKDPHTGKMTVHFDNAFRHNTRTAMGNLE